MNTYLFLAYLAVGLVFNVIMMWDNLKLLPQTVLFLPFWPFFLSGVISDVRKGKSFLTVLILAFAFSSCTPADDEEIVVRDVPVQRVEYPVEISYRRIRLTHTRETKILRDYTAAYYEQGDTIEVVPDDSGHFYVIVEAPGETAIVL